MPVAAQAQVEVARQVAALIHDLPRSPTIFRDIPLAPELAADIGFISSLVVDEKAGLTYLLHRGPKRDPVVVVNRAGELVRAWGRNMFKTPHSIRLDPEGNVWTVDSMSSTILKFRPDGTKLLQIDVGGQPDPAKTTGTSDIAFGPKGQVFIADGYGNARILEYDVSGQRVRAWGTHGTGPGQFNVPHALLVDGEILYVADRENGRVQKFDMVGNFLGQWVGLVKPMALSRAPDGTILVAIGYRNTGGVSPPWLAWIVSLDPASGKLKGALEVGDDAHGMTVAGGDVLTGGTTDGVAAVHAFPHD